MQNAFDFHDEEGQVLKCTYWVISIFHSSLDRLSSADRNWYLAGVMN